MIVPLKISTQVDVMLGPFVDKTDGVTAEAGLAGTATELSKAAGAFAAGPNLGTHDSDGFYPITLTTTHTNTQGRLLIKCVDAATHLPVWLDCWVYVANVYDSLFGAGTDKLDVNVEEWNTTAVPAEHTAGYPIVTVKDGAGTGEINTNAGKVVGVELVDVLTTYTGNTPQTGDVFPLASTEIAEIKAKTDLIPAAPAAVGDIPTAAQIADAVHDEVVEGTTTLRQSIRLANSANAGKTDGFASGASGTGHVRDIADGKNRVTADYDTNGNRTAVTLDVT